MQKIRLQQTQRKTLTSQQIQLINMLQKSQAQMDKAITKELTENPALEKLSDEKEQQETDDIDTYLQEKERPPRRITKNTPSPDAFVQNQTSQTRLPQEELLQQFHFLAVSDTQNLIAQHLIGSLTAQGYLPTPLIELAEEIYLLHDQEVTVQQVKQVLTLLKKIAPPGTAAQNVQQCLLWQLETKKPTPILHQAIEVVQHHFEAFTKKQYTKIAQKLCVSNEELKAIIEAITKLNPTPMVIPPANNTTLAPNFEVVVANGRTTITMLEKNTSRLTISKSYQALLKTHKKNKTTTSQEAVAFIQDKINRAKWFIQAIEKRKATLLKIMRAIVTLQKAFFETGDLTALRPIFLRNIAQAINMDVSTVSRAISQKAVQTNGHIYPLKYFFSEALPTTDGKQVSSRVIKHTLQQIIHTENKKTPYLDSELVNILKQKGYVLARRTVAKYREQLGLPIARLRKNTL